MQSGNYTAFSWFVHILSSILFLPPPQSSHFQHLLFYFYTLQMTLISIHWRKLKQLEEKFHELSSSHLLPYNAPSFLLLPLLISKTNKASDPVHLSYFKVSTMFISLSDPVPLSYFKVSIQQCLSPSPIISVFWHSIWPFQSAYKHVTFPS